MPRRRAARSNTEEHPMDALFSNAAFHSYAVCSAILAIKMLLTGNYTTYARMSNKAYVNPEDAKQLGGKYDEHEHPAVAHALRIQRNDLENIPLFFAIGLIFVLDGASPNASAAYCWTFTIARLAHWIAYLNHLQPWRAILYFVGYLAILGMAVQIIF
jgi:uncharacterized MAPEG superfamily protein